MYKKVLEVLGVGRDERVAENCSGSSCRSSSDSESSWHSAEPGADELDNFHGPTTESDSEIDPSTNCVAERAGFNVRYYGPNESDSAASTTSWHPRRKSRVKRSSRRSKSYSVPGIQDECLGEVVSRSRQLTLDNEVLAPEEDRLQKTGRLRGGFEAPSSTGVMDLKTIQIQKLHSLDRFDKDWGYLLPDKLENFFLWPWKTVTEQQVALGKLEFNKFIVALSCCQRWQLQPESALTMDQIRTLHQIPLEEIESFLNHEIAINKGVQNDRVSHIKKSCLKDQRVSYECHVDKSGSYIIKIVEPKSAQTLLHRTFGEDRIMPVFINEMPDDAPMIAQNGIIVGLRRYRLWTFKNSGKEDFQKRSESKDADYQRAIRCFFICTESLADVDLDDPCFKYFVHIHAARCHIMHINTASSIFKYSSRSQLALSKSTTADIDLQTMDEIKEIDDIYCKTLDDSGKQMSHTEGTGEISPEVAQMLPASVFKGSIDNKEGYPTLVQIRMFWEGMALKGTFLVNHKLDKKRIHYRRSMVKVDRSVTLKNFRSVNALEVLNTCREPHEAKLSQDLIVLLSLGRVPPTFFLNLLKTTLDNIQALFTNRNAAIKEVRGSTAEYGIRDQTLRMLIAGIPLTHVHMQNNLRRITLDKLKNLRRGCVPLPQSRYLMGTCDPTKEKILKRNQVAIAMVDGRICGKVLVYKNPGKHWGDVHVFDAVWDERLNPHVGPSKYTIIFSTNGDRPIVDEIANSDLDGDLYWVCNNAELISLFTPNLPWERPTSTGRSPAVKSPTQMSANELEIALFERFLKARFANGNLPPPMPLAATYWLAHMDQYLTMRDAVHPSIELGVVKKKIDELINIFYRALDAEKIGEEVILPWRLRPEMWPHYMKKPNAKNRYYYQSTSIIGQLHDMACVEVNNFGHAVEDIMDYDPKFQFEGFENYTSKWKVLFQQYNDEMKLLIINQQISDEESAKDRRHRVITKYQEILKGERKPLHQIWEEASALYHINFEHARRFLGSKFTPSMFGAFSIAGTYLCEIYARNEGVDPGDHERGAERDAVAETGETGGFRQGLGYPNETEERFEWPWQSLTLEQATLGRLDFRKFIVSSRVKTAQRLEPRIWRRISATIRASTGVFLF